VQWIEQMFGNANSLRAPYALYDEWIGERGFSGSAFYNLIDFPPSERKENIKGTRDAIPDQYGEVPEYTYIAGGQIDISTVKSSVLESKIRRAHSLIWAGGKRDPLTAFDEWSKLLFAKVIDERATPTSKPRSFQVGTNETIASVANRIHRLFAQACKQDPSIFPAGLRISLNDKKICEVVRTLQEVSFLHTDVDSVGAAFENFFGSVFRGELGQYFTMRQLARFTVAMLALNHHDYVIDPTAGSGGFLLEALLQVWHSVDQQFRGQASSEVDRLKVDFAFHKVYGIEIHEVLARILKINLLLHHDGHTNIEGDRTCLDSHFTLPRLNPPSEKFTCVVGNPPFGDEVEEGDEDHLGGNSLANFFIASNRTKLPSEHVILERSIEFLEPGGRLGLVVPDGLLNNQGELSNCPQVRRFLAKSGIISAIVSLPDYAFRKSGAQNKTSILFFQKFTKKEAHLFRRHYDQSLKDNNEYGAITAGLRALNYQVFMAEANWVGYTPTGAVSRRNDLYNAGLGGSLAQDQSGTILGEFQRFRDDPSKYDGRTMPDCMTLGIADLWTAHASHRLDPKYFLFKRQERSFTPAGWIRETIGHVMRRREIEVNPELAPNDSVLVMTIAQSGEIRPREAGKGRNPPEWLGMYFEESPSSWFKAQARDVVFSSIDLWKGCISVVPDEFDDAIVTKEFPIYEVTDGRLDPQFLSYLLRSRYYQRAFRAITTGHSNRRRTQPVDFEALEICFPADRKMQAELISGLVNARGKLKQANLDLRGAMLSFSDIIDGRGAEELPEVEADVVEDEAA
jgi:type I restriction enzyme M protein